MMSTNDKIISNTRGLNSLINGHSNSDLIEILPRIVRSISSKDNHIILLMRMW